MRKSAVNSRVTLPNSAALSVWCAVAFLLCSSIPAAAYNLPDSDQRTCFDVATCVGSGQDGEYIRNPLSYTDNGTTVTDNNTGLVWQKADNGNSYTWGSAVLACAALGPGFRLPSKKELMTIINYAVPYPGPTISAPFTGTRQTFYWTSTSNAANAAHAWGVNFNFGSVYVYYKDAAQPIRCVKDAVAP